MLERRKYVRIKEEDIISISYTLMAHPNVSRHLSRDLSQGGIRFLSDHFIPPLSLVKIRIELKSSKKNINGMAKVVWISSIFGDEKFEAGLEFTEINQEDLWFLKLYLDRKAHQESRINNPGYPPK